MVLVLSRFFFFFNDTATTEIYTLSLHDALPISDRWRTRVKTSTKAESPCSPAPGDRKSTRLTSSHITSSYAVFCLKKKKKTELGSLLIIIERGQEKEANHT